MKNTMLKRLKYFSMTTLIGGPNLYIINPLLYKDFNKFKLFSSEYLFSIVNYLNSELFLVEH